VTVVRGIWADLVAKRLWPVAAALVVALVAIPVVLAKPAPKAPAPPAPLASAGPAPLVATPAAIRSNSSGAPVGGKFKDPFKQLHLPKPAKDSSGAGGGKDAAAAGAGGLPAPGTGGGSGFGGGGSRPSGGSGGSGGSDHIVKLKVRFGLANGKRTVREITPGTALPATSNPLIVYLDVKHGAGHFLVSSDVTKTEGDGSGTCKPSQTVCSELEVEAGNTQFFDTQSGEQYQLDVLEVVKD
jgi:hypothetical protein